MKMKETCLDLSAPAAGEWARTCLEMVPGLKRGDKSPIMLKLPQENVALFEKCGV